MARKKRFGEPGFREHAAGLCQALETLPPVVAVYGENEFLRSQAVGALQAALQAQPGLDILTLYGPGRGGDAGCGLRDVLEALESRSLFAAQKAVLLRRGGGVLFPAKGAADTDGAEENEEAAARLAKKSRTPDAREALVEWLRAPAPGLRLLVECESLPGNQKLGKVLLEHTAVPCPELSSGDAQAWLADTTRKAGLRLDGDAARLLIEAHGSRLGLLQGELEKLALYAGEPAITAETVRAFWTGAVEFDLFGFTNALEARDLRQALLYAARIATQGARNPSGKREEGKNAVHMALGMAANTVEQLFRAKAAAAAGGGVSAAAASLKQGEWRAQKLLEAARRYSFREVREASRRVAEEIGAAHDTGGDGRLALERLAVALCRAHAP